MFLVWLRQLPQCGDQTPASVPPPAEDRSSVTNTPVSPPSSFVLRSFAWFCVFFSPGQVLLSALSWGSACTSIWRCTPDESLEMYSMSTYSSTILFSPMIFFWMLSFKPTFSLSSFTLIRRLFSLFSAIRMVSSVYLRFLILLPAVLIPACDSSSPAFRWHTLHISYISRMTIYSLDVLLS